jgi:hypothetical protein
MFETHAIVGFCVSFTVTVKLQLGPDATEQFTVVVPIGKNVPDAGVLVTIPQGPVVIGAA